MNHKGYLAYDNDEFFEKYHEIRRKEDASNELIEQPIINELFRDVSGKNILDLGCGDEKYK